MIRNKIGFTELQKGKGKIMNYADVLEWCWVIYTIALETGPFIVLNTKLKDLFVVIYAAYIFIQVHSQMFIQL